MHRRDARNTARGAVRLRWVLLVAVLVAGVVGGLLLLRPELLTGPPAAAPDPETDPAAVAPPAGLDLPPLPEPTPVAEPVAAEAGGQPDAAAVRRALRDPLGDDALGPHVVAGVGSLDGASSVLVGARDAAVPASTTKLMTSVAALEALGPDRRFATTVVGSEPGAGTGSARRITLVGGGDPLLESQPDPDREVGDPERADLRTLARRTASALREDGVERVRVTYDDTLFTGPRASPTWEDDYLVTGVVSPISALWADRGVRPDEVRASNPPYAAAQAFSRSLREVGIETVGVPQAAPAPADAPELARVVGIPVDLLVEHLNETSDNEVGEVLAHHVGLEVDGEGSFAGGARGVTATLEDLGVDLAGSELNDGSGLSRANRLTPDALLDALAVAADAERPELRATLTGLPVAGFTGSLASRFDTVDPAGLGDVRGKTGTLTGVSALSGVVTTADGAVLTYAVSADRIDPARTLDAIQAIDRAVAALAACTCAV